MPISRAAKSIPVASRVNRFSYAIRNIVTEAQAAEARGTRVRYLNIGDPVAFGFQTPVHLIEAAERAMRDGHNGYLPSPGIAPAREAVAADYAAKGIPISADRVLITTGTSENARIWRVRRSGRSCSAGSVTASDGTRGARLTAGSGAGTLCGRR